MLKSLAIANIILVIAYITLAGLTESYTLIGLVALGWIIVTATFSIMVIVKESAEARAYRAYIDSLALRNAPRARRTKTK